MKLKHKIITKMITKKLTRAEVDFLLYIAQYQSDSGEVIGIYYKEIIKALNISYQTFYDLKNSLSKKGLITAEKGSYTDWNICILENDFHYQSEDDKEPVVKNDPYLNLNFEIFSKNEFKAMKAGEKLLFLEFFRMQVASKGKYSIKIRVEEFYKKYKALFGVQKRVLQDYLTTLKQFFSIGIKNGMYYITALKDTMKKDSRVENQVRDEYAFHVLCRRDRIAEDESAKDTLALIKQYAKKGCNFFMLQKAILKSWKILNKGIEDVKSWRIELKPDLIHKLLLTIL
ncbi:MAG TPA: hypothetical protein IAC14_07880 [Candidatus Scybalomonas excrementigallinarum]|nr:hypothetical protein [Candidatus Scybalomonas excrementigallinarum]